MMEKKKKSDYKSTKEYNKKYNSENINVQLNRELINKVKDKLDGSNTLKSYIEELIKNDL
jgi:hypothetical protein